MKALAPVLKFGRPLEALSEKRFYYQPQDLDYARANDGRRVFYAYTFCASGGRISLFLASSTLEKFSIKRDRAMELTSFETTAVVPSRSTTYAIRRHTLFRRE